MLGSMPCYTNVRSLPVIQLELNAVKRNRVLPCAFHFKALKRSNEQLLSSSSGSTEESLGEMSARRQRPGFSGIPSFSLSGQSQRPLIGYWRGDLRTERKQQRQRAWYDSYASYKTTPPTCLPLLQE